MLSDEQRQILGFTNNLVSVSALPGTGKTYSIYGLVKKIKQKNVYANVLCCAYNRANAISLQNKIFELPENLSYNITVSTIHKESFAQFKNKYKNLHVDETATLSSFRQFLLDDGLAIESLEYIPFNFINVIINLMKENITNDPNFILQKYSLTFEQPENVQIDLLNAIQDYMLQFNQNCLQKKEGTYFNGKRKITGPHIVIDFTDMLYIPYIKNLFKNSNNKYDYIIIDESQDLSVIKLKFLESILKENGTMFFFGDRNQCINQYAGSTTELFDEICQKSEKFSINITRRCAKSIVNYINNCHNSNMIAHEDAKEGEIRNIKHNDVKKELVNLINKKETVLLLHLNNAPLFDLYLDLLKNNVLVNIQGHEIYDYIMTLINSVNNLTELNTKINKILGGLFKKLKFLHPNLSTMQIKKLDAFQSDFQPIRILKRILMEYFEIDLDNEETDLSTITLPTKELKEKLMFLFQTNRKSNITLSTVHKSKGQESDIVFLLDYSQMANNQTLDPMQGINLHFVALSRAKEILYLVETDKNNNKKTNIETD